MKNEELIASMDKNGSLKMIQAHYISDVAKEIQKSNISSLKMIKNPKHNYAHELAFTIAIQYLNTNGFQYSVGTIGAEFENGAIQNKNVNAPEKLKIKQGSIWIKELLKSWKGKEKLIVSKNREKEHAVLEKELRIRGSDGSEGFPTIKGPVKLPEPTKPVAKEPVKPLEPTKPVAKEPVKLPESTKPVVKEPVKPPESTKPVAKEPVKPPEPTKPVAKEPVKLPESTKPVVKEPVKLPEPTKPVLKEPIKQPVSVIPIVSDNSEEEMQFDDFDDIGDIGDQEAEEDDNWDSFPGIDDDSDEQPQENNNTQVKNTGMITGSNANQKVINEPKENPKTPVSNNDIPKVSFQMTKQEDSESDYDLNFDFDSN